MSMVISRHRKPNLAHDLERLKNELRRDPPQVVARFRRLLAESSGFGDPIRSTDFRALLADLTIAVVRLFEEDNTRAVDLVEAGLVEAVIEVVELKDYFSWPVFWRAKPLFVLSVTIEHAGRVSTDARDRIFRTTTRLFKGIWERRDIVRLADPGVYHLGGAVDDSTALSTLLEAYYLIYRFADRAPELDTYIHHVHILLWVLSREEDEVPGIAFHGMLTTSLFSAWGPSLKDMQTAEKEIGPTPEAYLDVSARLVRESIIEGMGPDRFIAACEAELRGLIRHLECSCGNGVHDVQVLVLHVVTHDDVMPTVYKRDLLVQALDALKLLFENEVGAGKCTSLCMSCLYLVQIYYVYSARAAVKSAEPHRHPDIVDLYVIAMELVAAGCSLTVSKGDIHGAITASLGDIMQRIQDNKLTAGNNSPKYISALQHRAALYWYPTLQRLQRAVPTIERERQLRTVNLAETSTVLYTWIAFGALLGLDANEQRRRHESDRLQRCWWRECQRSRDRGDATVKLLACAGCGEVRYCNKHCQRLDWKIGGHKRMCRRLK